MNQTIYRPTDAQGLETARAGRYTSFEQARRSIRQSSLHVQYISGTRYLIAHGKEAGFASVKKDRKVTIRGKCNGARREPRTTYEALVTFIDCELISGDGRD